MHHLVETILNQHDLVVSHRNGQVMVRLDAFGTWGKGVDIVSAMDKLRARLSEHLEDLESVDALDQLPVARRGMYRGGQAWPDDRKPWWDVRGFLLRLLIVGALAGGGAAMLMGAVSRAANNFSAGLEPKFAKVVERLSPSALLASAEKRLHAFATDPSLHQTPERRQEVLNDLRESVRILKPYVDELAPLAIVPKSPNCR